MLTAEALAAGGDEARRAGADRPAGRRRDRRARLPCSGAAGGEGLALLAAAATVDQADTAALRRAVFSRPLCRGSTGLEGATVAQPAAWPAAASASSSCSFPRGRLRRTPSSPGSASFAARAAQALRARRARGRAPPRARAHARPPLGRRRGDRRSSRSRTRSRPRSSACRGCSTCARSASTSASSGRFETAAAAEVTGPHSVVAERLLDLALGPFRARGFVASTDAARDRHLAAVRAAVAGGGDRGRRTRYRWSPTAT